MCSVRAIAGGAYASPAFFLLFLKVLIMFWEMTQELPTLENIANKITLFKQNLMQIVTDPKYQKFQDELFIIQNFLSGKENSMTNVGSALKSIQSKSAS
jgi:hypothetical protein